MSRLFSPPDVTFKPRPAVFPHLDRSDNSSAGSFRRKHERDKTIRITVEESGQGLARVGGLPRTASRGVECQQYLSDVSQVQNDV